MIKLSPWKTKTETRTSETEAKRKKTYAATMAKRKIEKSKERGVFYCQVDGSKHYQSEPRFTVCEKCFRALVKDKQPKQ